MSRSRRRSFSLPILSLIVCLALMMTGGVAAQVYTFTRLAGTEGGPGYFDGKGSAARFNSPPALAVDDDGNVYVADEGNHTIRKISPGGEVWTLAGSNGDPGSSNGSLDDARFLEPRAVAVDASGNIFIGDSGNALRKITPRGRVEVFSGGQGWGYADGPPEEARFNTIRALATDAAGNVYLTEWGNYTVRKITPAGFVTTLAGSATEQGSMDGSGTGARFSFPAGLAVDTSGNVFVADSINHTIRKVTPAGTVTTFAGTAGMTGDDDGIGSAARFWNPRGLTIDSEGNLFVADRTNHRIRRITPEGVVTTLAGRFRGSADGIGTAARFSYPNDVTADPFGNVYVADLANETIRRIAPGGQVTTFAGHAAEYGFTDGVGSDARFQHPGDAAIDAFGNLVVADSGSSRIRMVTPAGEVTILAGGGGNDGDGPGTSAGFFSPQGIAVDQNNNIFVADTENHTIRKIVAGVVTTIAGSSGDEGNVDGTGSEARFYRPEGIAVDGSGNVFVADSWNHTIRKVAPDGVVSTVAGVAGESGMSDGRTEARFDFPRGIAFDSAGNLFVADSRNNVIRRIDSDGEVTTYAGIPGSIGGDDGPPGTGSLALPTGIAIDEDGTLYVSENGFARVREISPDGFISTVGGSVFQEGNVEGDSDAVRFSSPVGLAVAGNGDLFIVDQGHHVIYSRKEALPDAASIDSSLGPRGGTRTLFASPATAGAWEWRLVGRPADSTASLSASAGSSVSFTPDQLGKYVFRLEATGGGMSSVTFVEFEAVPNRGRPVRR